MPRGVKKEHLPTKVCVVCQQPYTWRKKWEAVWDEVTTCSKSCNRRRRTAKQQQKQQSKQHERVLPTMQMAQETSTHDDDKSEKYEPSSSRSMPAANEASLQILVQDVTDDLSSWSVAETDSAEYMTEKELTRALLAEEEDEGDDDDHVESEDDSSTRGYSSSTAPSAESQLVDLKAARKAAKKRAKADRRAQRQGLGDPSHGQKDCDVCSKSVDLLIRCTTDETATWRMVCGKCWKDVSGGVVDGDARHPHYRYGGLWKNRAKRS